MAKVIGIDLGGTKISGILMDENGQIIKKESRPTEADRGKKTVIENLMAIINLLKTEEVTTIGLATPGFALPDGRLTCIVNIPGLKNVNLRKELEKKTGMKVILENDAKCFALAEQKLGAARKYKDVIGVILGTGVGGGIIIDGKIYRGAFGSAGEIGHTSLSIDGQPIEVENLISGTAFLKKYNALSGKSMASLNEVNKKEDAYKKAYNLFVFHTGIFFSNLIYTFNPECIVIGGGVSNIDFYKDVEKVVRKYCLPDLAKACKIVKNKLGDDSGVIGAAMLALNLLS